MGWRNSRDLLYNIEPTVNNNALYTWQFVKRAVLMLSVLTTRTHKGRGEGGEETWKWWARLLPWWWGWFREYWIQQKGDFLKGKGLRRDFILPWFLRGVCIWGTMWPSSVQICFFYFMLGRVAESTTADHFILLFWNAVTFLIKVFNCNQGKNITSIFFCSLETDHSLKDTKKRPFWTMA